MRIMQEAPPSSPKPEKFLPHFVFAYIYFPSALDTLTSQHSNCSRLDQLKRQIGREARGEKV